MPPIRLAIIGCGLAARDLHWPALRRIPSRFSVTTVCNHTAPKARSFAKVTGCNDWTTDYRDILRRDDVDAVDIILPFDLNHEVVKASLAAGKHVIVEKPLAASLKDARSLVRIARKSDRTAMVAENFRYRPVLRQLEALIRKGTLGGVHTARWEAFTEMSPKTSAYGRTPWRLEDRFPGGYIMDAGVHVIHGIRMLFGEIEAVHAATRSVNPAIGREDTMAMLFRTVRGVDGSFTVHFTAKGYRGNRLLVFGTKATAELADNRLTIHRPRAKPRTRAIKDDGGYLGQFKDFHRAVRNGNPPEAVFEEGFRDFAVIMAALDSARGGRWVRPAAPPAS